MEIAAVFNDIWENFTGYFGGKRFFVFFVLMMVVACVYNRKSLVAHRVLAYVLILLGVIFCPFTAHVIMNDMIGEDVYWRMFWLLPVTFVVAYVSGVFIKKNLLFIIPLIAALVFCGNNLYLQNRIEPPQNFYKLEEEVVALVDLINEDAGDGYKKACFPQSIYCYPRQIDASILMPYGRNAERKTELSDVQKKLFKAMEAESKDYERIHKLLKKNDCNYVVMSNDTFPADMEKAGFSFVAQTENYRLYLVEKL